MTTRKQVQDAYLARKTADEQQRASNGQFGSGGGAEPKKAAEPAAAAKPARKLPHWAIPTTPEQYRQQGAVKHFIRKDESDEQQRASNGQFGAGAGGMPSKKDRGAASAAAARVNNAKPKPKSAEEAVKAGVNYYAKPKEKALNIKWKDSMDVDGVKAGVSGICDALRRI